jgi:HSP20 family protein
MAVKQSETEQERQHAQHREQSQQNQENPSQQNRHSQQNQERQPRGLARRDLEPLVASLALSPFTMLRQFFMGDVDELLSPGRTARNGAPTRDGAASMTAWVPKIDVFQQGNELVVRADLPGLDPEDVTVDISDDAVTIAGERRQEREEEHGGVYRIERSYGAFHRVVPLPDGAITDRANATFRDGVLEIRMPAPPEQVSRGRRLEVSRGDTKESNASAESTATTRPS